MTRSRRCAHLLPSVSLPFSLPTLPVSRITRLPALLCLFLLSSCYINVPYGGSSWHTVTGAGDVTSEVRPVGNIRSVNLDNQGDLIIRLGDSESLLVEAEENLLDYIVTEVRGDELHIYNDGNYFFRTHEPIRYYLTVKNLEGISAGSVGSVTAPDLSADRFQIRVGSTGSVSIDALRAGAVDIDVASTGNVFIDEIDATVIDVNISSTGHVNVYGGEVSSQNIRINSTGSYDAMEVQSDVADVRINSTGSAYITVNDYLEAVLNSTGGVRYRGDARTDIRRNSVGNAVLVGRR